MEDTVQRADEWLRAKLASVGGAGPTRTLTATVCDYFYRSFVKQVVPICMKKGVGVIGMKSLGGSPDGRNGRIVQAGLASAEQCIRFALSQSISSLVVGIRTKRDLRQALSVGRRFESMPKVETLALLERVKGEAGDGRHELFKSSKQFDGPHHRKQHGFAVET